MGETLGQCCYFHSPGIILEKRGAQALAVSPERQAERREGGLLGVSHLQSGTPRAPKTEKEEYFFFRFLFTYLFSKIRDFKNLNCS